jgi:hypothetical protein
MAVVHIDILVEAGRRTALRGKRNAAESKEN